MGIMLRVDRPLRPVGITQYVSQCLALAVAERRTGQRHLLHFFGPRTVVWQTLSAPLSGSGANALCEESVCRTLVREKVSQRHLLLLLLFGRYKGFASATVAETQKPDEKRTARGAWSVPMIAVVQAARLDWNDAG